MMRLIIPGEKRPTEDFSILHAAKAGRKGWLIFQGLELLVAGFPPLLFVRKALNSRYLASAT